jgi:hypothetical protein
MGSSVEDCDCGLNWAGFSLLSSARLIIRHLATDVEKHVMCIASSGIDGNTGTQIFSTSINHSK